MALTYITITGTFDDGSGTPLSGQVVFTPSSTVYASGVPVVSVSNPVIAQVQSGSLAAGTRLLSTASAGLSFPGLTGFFFWTAQVTLGTITQAPWSFFLPLTPTTQDLYALANTGAGGSGINPPAGDIGGTASSPTVVSTHLASPLALAQGGTATSAASYAALLATMGAAALAGATFTGAVAPAVVALTDAATILVNAAAGNDFRVTLGGNRTLGAPTNPVDGQKVIFQVTQDSNGSRTLAYTSGAGGYEFSTGLASPTLSTGGGVTDLLGFVYNAAKNRWLFAAFVNGFS